MLQTTLRSSAGVALMRLSRLPALALLMYIMLSVPGQGAARAWLLHCTVQERLSCRGVKQPKGKAAYIKINEEEIADDYPMPAQYPMEEEEFDEFVVNGDEDLPLDIDPECLPKMVRFWRMHTKRLLCVHVCMRACVNPTPHGAVARCSVYTRMLPNVKMGLASHSRMHSHEMAVHRIDPLTDH